MQHTTLRKRLSHSAIILLTAVIGIFACTRVPISNRRQLKLQKSSTMTSLSADAYQQFLSENRPLPDSDPRVQRVKSIGTKIAAATERLLRKTGHAGEIKNYDWTFNVVDDPTINAWCMPGGNFVFYTGIMDLFENDDQLATVMGHEIAHAVGRHGNERMSQQMAVQGIAVASNVALSGQSAAAQNLFMQAYGVGSQVGMLKFSRTHETEADEMGLIFMVMAGYDPNASVRFWQIMDSKTAGAGRPPQFLSTHPHPDTRIQNLKEYIPTAKSYAKKYGSVN